MTKLLSFLIVLSSVFASCQEKVQQETKDLVPQSPFVLLVDAEMETYITDARENNFLHPVRSFYMHGDSISFDSLVVLYKQEEVAAIFSEIVHVPKTEVFERKEGMTVVIESDSSDQEKSTGIIQLHFRELIQAYSHDHLASHGFSPTHLQLVHNKNNTLFMSLSSAETGTMDAIVYDKKSGHRLTGFKGNEYDGSFYLGNLTKVPEGIDTLSLALKVGEQIHYQDFAFSDVKEEDSGGE